MAPEPSPSKSSGMLSLYANLLEPSADVSPTPGTISRPPVVFKQSLESDPQLDDSAAKKQQISAGSELPSFHN
jgi:splicing factor 45